MLQGFTARTARESVCFPRYWVKCIDGFLVERTEPSPMMQWCPVVDHGEGDVYLISPLTGNLLVVPLDKWGSEATARDLSRQGLTPDAQVSALDLREDRSAYIPAPHPSVTLSRWSRAGLSLLWRLLHHSVAMIGLLGSVSVLSRIASLFRDGRRGATEQILDVVKVVEGEYHGEKCLVRSLLRFFLLRRAGWSAGIALGVFPPTARMHAWVVVDGKAIGEEPDELMHYQPVLLLGYR